MATTRKSRRSSRRARTLRSDRSRRHGDAKGSGWASGRAPSSVELWASGKPIEIRKIGRKWGVAVMGHPVVRLPNGSLTFRGRADFVDGQGAALFTKEDAQHVAHKIGRYMFNLGDLAFGYVEGW